ncbi:MAG: rRNA maturation RNase YbeY [Dehalococcoidales bacterium]|nr:MAG: rRNA maturation RNase YbeY [Dehalococcoidales bacterium]
MEVNVLIDEEFEGELEAGWLRGITEQVLLAEGTEPKAELGLVITSQARIQELNLVHLDIDAPTDVLAFPMTPDEDSDIPAFVTPPDGSVHLGEVIVSFPQAFLQAEEHGHPVKKEVALLIVHGVLHLLGYDHDTPEPEQRMRAREARILELIEEKGW